ncbi:MAG: hypothetical protein RL398_299 [Planctomycetota bacterium]|jgi:4-amino-4-deoxy-L-arabinose transferase-like glycosyltransferase
MKRGERIVLIGIVVGIAVALRAAFVLVAQVPDPLRADAGEYAQYAKNLVDFGVFASLPGNPPEPDSFRSPGYPVFLASCRLLAGGDGWLSLALWLQVALGAATVGLTYRLARTMVPFWPAALAAVLAAASPHLAVSSGYVLTECLTTFLLTLALERLSRAPGQAVGAHLVAGLAFGAVALTNEALALLPIAFALPLWRSRGWRPAVALAVAAIVPLSAWNVRNRITPLARTGGERVTASISHGSYPGMVYADPRYFGFPYREDPEQPQFGRDWHSLGVLLARRVEAEPARYLRWYLIDKPLWLWSWNTVQGDGHLVYPARNDPFTHHAVVGAVRWSMHWLHVPLMLLAAVAALRAGAGRGAPPAATMLGRAVVFGTLLYLPVIPDPRYLQPLRPALFVLAAYGAWRLVRWLALRRLAADARRVPATA